MSKNLLIRVDDQMAAALAEQRKQTGAATSEFIRRAVADRLRQVQVKDQTPKGE